LDVYSSIVWGGIIRHREAQSNVRYPGDLRDEFIFRNDTVSPTSVDQSVASANGASNDWIIGWNFTTDMYRILEHALDSQRRRSPPNNGTAEVWSLFRPAQMAGPWLMEHVLAMYSALPPPFREARPAIGDISHDIYGFQSANIQATLQLLRMVIYSSEEQGVDGKCDVAGQVLSVFSKVPVEYLKAISSPLVCRLYRHLLICGDWLILAAASSGWNWVHTWIGDGGKSIRVFLSARAHSSVSPHMLV
jgi:hypothetical protein